MDERVRTILNGEDLIANRDNWFHEMSELFYGERKKPLYLAGMGADAAHPDLMYTDPEAWIREGVEFLAENVYSRISDKYFVPLCIYNSIYGVHFIDRIFGCDVFFQDGQWYNRYLKNEVGQLKMPDLENNETWALAKRIALAFLDLNIKAPLFETPVIASPLNIAVNLYGEEILVAMLMEPEAAHHDLQIISQVLTELHRWYQDHIPAQQLQPVVACGRCQPPGHGQICGCTTQLLSPGLYEEFIMPLDDAILGLYPHGGMIHLCGSHTQLIPLFAKMPHLKCVQLNDKAAEDLQFYVDGLRDDQVIYFSPCEGISTKQALKIAGNKKLVIVYGYEEE